MSDIWFNGPVRDAVSLVAERQCVFLVYIHDNSDKSNVLSETFKNEQVAETIKKKAVALSMEKDSENAIMFGQFYPVNAVPIVYFIKQGTIRDFGIETMSSQEIVDKINAVDKIVPAPVAAPAASTAVSPPPPPPPPPPPSVSTLPPTLPQQQQQQQVSPASDSYTPTSASSSSVDSTAATISTTDTSSTAEQDALLAKKAELKKQLEQARKERAEREQQEAREREIKRRQEAKMMQEAKQSRVEKENKVYFDKLKKERKEDEEHRKRVREQIARDRAEKIAQRNAEKQRSNSLSSSQSLTSPTTEGSSSSISSSNNNSQYSNLNIRQLDGSNLRHQFQASSTLSTVREWIEQNRTEDTKKPYKLSAQFPTRLFVEADDDKTLKDLNLCPSATVIMKPLKVSATSGLMRGVSSSNRGNNGIMGYAYSAFDFIYGLVVAIFSMLTGILATLFPTSGLAHQDVSRSQQQAPLVQNLRGGQRLGGEGGSSSQSAGESSSTAKNTQRRNPFATRISTLHEDDNNDDDDKRPTYNGNSVNHE